MNETWLKKESETNHYFVKHNKDYDLIASDFD